jgi:hypothetical protein
MKKPEMKKPAAAPAIACKRPAAATGATPKVGEIDNRKSKKSKYPAMSLDAPVHWAGGRIYHSASKRTFRVYKRKQDKVESGVNYGRDATQEHIQSKWHEACKLILDDPRVLS